jgi:hypothetical protein
VKTHGQGVPPAELVTFTGSTAAEGEAWLAARDEWWDATHDDDDPGGLTWLLDGLDQVPDPPFCGFAADCSTPGCVCGSDGDSEHGQAGWNRDARVPCLRSSDCSP